MTWLACTRCGRSIVADLDLVWVVDTVYGEELWDKRDVPLWWEDQEDPETGWSIDWIVPDLDAYHERCAPDVPRPGLQHVASICASVDRHRTRSIAEYEAEVYDEDFEPPRSIETVPTGSYL